VRTEGPRAWTGVRTCHACVSPSDGQIIAACRMVHNEQCSVNVVRIPVAVVYDLLVVLFWSAAAKVAFCPAAKASQLRSDRTL
jgi:hypothetical protein